MTRLLNPSIIITRLVVKRNAGIAYDEEFHAGVNVIRGENSSGKSTIMNFLCYGLGGDIFDWDKLALLCTHVWMEVQINGHPATLRREVSESAQTAMEIFGGPYTDALKAPVESWTRYPYKRSTQKESFSQALFHLMGMPDVASEGSGNITMHQLLRLLYTDQLSPIESLFRQESFDPPTLRETIGNLLCGAYDDEVYGLQIRLRAEEKEYQDVSSDLRSIIALLKGGDQSTGIQWVEEQKTRIIEERDAQLAAISEAEQAYYAKQNDDTVSRDAQKTVYQQVQTLQKTLNRSREEINALEFEIADSSRFIASLENKIDALRDAQSVSDLFGTVIFASCPACYAEIEETDIEACHLCKTPYDVERAKERIVGLMNEASIQLKQSRILQGRRDTKLGELKRKYKASEDQWKRAARELQTLEVLPSTAARDRLRELHRKLGYLDRELDDFEGKLELARKIDTLRQRKEALNASMERIRTRIDELRAAQQKRLIEARAQIESNVKYFLTRDLRRQDVFENPESVDFSFKDNRISVDGESYVSASSRVILKNSFAVGFLKSAMEDPKFRHPRFLMLDTTEDKGMEVQRSENFQNQILEMSQGSDAVHQVIYATAMPSNDIPDDDLIGEFSTRDNGTLNIQSAR
ncbi:MAG: hypothetical protein AAFQ19_03990 [Pseudomonadota bacterium]